MWNSGDIIIGDRQTNKDVERRIINIVLPGTEGLEEDVVSYMWEYPDLESGDSNEFWSGNSSDPELIFWKLKVK